MKANKTYTQNEKTSQEFFYEKRKWKMKNLPSLKREKLKVHHFETYIEKLKGMKWNTNPTKWKNRTT